MSTSSDQATIGTPQASSAVSAASGPSIPKARATAVQANSPASPTSPVIVLTADLGPGIVDEGGVDLEVGC